MNQIQLGAYYRLSQGVIFEDENTPRAPASGTLPPNRQGLPVELSGQGTLDAMMAPGGARAEQIQWARPAVEDPEVLTPTGFQDALSAAVDSLGELSARRSDADELAVLRRGVRLLKEQALLREQVQMLSRALLEG